jgi:hypothetical protein
MQRSQSWRHRPFLPENNGNDSKAKSLAKSLIYKAFAVRTGLEPATSCVTGRHSNQLNYRTKLPNLTIHVLDCPKRECKDSFAFNFSKI